MIQNLSLCHKGIAFDSAFAHAPNNSNKCALLPNNRADLSVSIPEKKFSVSLLFRP